jgi:hypothetical protein
MMPSQIVAEVHIVMPQSQNIFMQSRLRSRN